MAFADAAAGRVVSFYSGGALQQQLTLAGTVKCGDPIGYTSAVAAPGWVRADCDAAADATASTCIAAAFVALQDGVSGDVISVSAHVLISTGLSGMTVGDKLYAGPTAGTYVNVKPDAVSGDSTTAIGRALTATSAVIMTNPTLHGYTVKA